MKNFFRQNKFNIIGYLTAIALIIALYSLSALVVDSVFVLPKIGVVLKSAWQMLGQKSFYVAFLLTLLRSLIAFSVAFILALGLVIISNKRPLLKSFITPFVALTRALPTIAIILLVLIWTNRFIAPIIVTFLVVFPTTFTGVENAVNKVSKEDIQTCKLYKVKNSKVIKKVILPQIAPSVITLIGTGLALNLKLMVAAEVLSATAKSLGNMLNIANINLEMGYMIAIVSVCVITGCLIEFIFRLISKKVGKWQ